MDTEQILNQLKQIAAIAVKPALTIQEAAIYLGISESSLRKYIDDGSIAHYKPRKHIYIDKTELDRFVHTNRIESNDDIRRKAAIFTDNNIIPL